MKSIFSKEQVEFLKLNYNKMKYSEIADLFGLTERQVRGKINSLGLSKTRKFNKQYFKEINTNNKAYWLGFIYADGYIIRNTKSRNYELGIELNKKDVALLQLFNKELGNVHEITFKHGQKYFNGYNYETDSCVIRVYSKEIVNDLMSLNVMQDKTNKKDFPICNNEYFFDFLRGFMDGDGCIYINSNKNLLNVHFTNSNISFLEYLNNEIKNRLCIEGSIYKETEKKYKLFYFRQDDVKILLDEIYKNCSTKLERKYLKYKSFYTGSPL